MKRLVPIPPEAATALKTDASSSELGYQFVSVKLKDGRIFDQAIESEGCIIQVKGHRNIPFTEQDLASVEPNAKPWNFRRTTPKKPPAE
jgi:hypothetical protein